MTVEQLIDELRKYDLDLPVDMGETGEVMGIEGVYDGGWKRKDLIRIVLWSEK